MCLRVSLECLSSFINTELTTKYSTKNCTEKLINNSFH